MSILIKGMEMPKNCMNCPMNYDSIDCTLVDNISLRDKDLEFLYEDKRHPNCPLIEQKVGKWLRTPTFWVYCSVCGREPPDETNATTLFCPNCGAEMREEDGEDD